MTSEFEIADDAGLLLLQTGLEAFDRMRSCQAAIKTDGEQVEDRFGQWKAHPLLATERDARSAMLLALKHLNLDVVPGQSLGEIKRGSNAQPDRSGPNLPQKLRRIY